MIINKNMNVNKMYCNDIIKLLKYERIKSMDITLSIKDNLLLDDRLKPQEVYLFMQLVRLCDRTTGELNISASELMEETRFTNKSLMLGYLKTLIQCNYIDRLENLNKKAVYKVNRGCFYK